MKTTVQQLRYLLKVDETHLIVAAAKELGISQAALSAAIAKVEDEFGFKIFTRGKKGAFPTPEGKEFLAQASVVVNDMDDLERFVVRDDVEKTRFAVSMQLTGFAYYALMKLANNLDMRKYELSSKESMLRELFDEVCSGASDMGIVILTKRDELMLDTLNVNDCLEMHELFEATPFAYLDQAHPLAKKRILTQEDLYSYPYFPIEQCIYLHRKQREQDRKAAMTISSGSQETRSDYAFDLVESIKDVNGYTVWPLLVPRIQSSSKAVTIAIGDADPVKIGYLIKKGRELRDFEKTYISYLLEYMQ